MQINWDDKKYLYDPTKIDVATAMVIRERSGGWGLKTFAQHVDDWDPLAAQLLLFAIKRQNGEPCDPLQLEFDVPRFMSEVTRASLEELNAQVTAGLDAEGKKKASPSKAGAGRTRKKTPTSATTATSTSSPSPTSAT